MELKMKLKKTGKEMREERKYAVFTATAIPAFIQPLVNMAGGPMLFSFLIFAIVAIISAIFKMDWGVSLMLFFMTFGMLAGFGVFSYAVVTLIGMLMFGVIAYGFTKIWADLIFG